MRKKNILTVNHGGLGDNLSFSTLPEQFFKQKKTKIYFSKLTYFRNKEIYDLVWMKNPYIFGTVKKSGNLNVRNNIRFLKKYNIIQNTERAYGLEVRNKYPKIYYKPLKKKIKNFFLVDASSVSIFYSPKEQEIVNKKIKELKKKFKNYKFVNLTFKKKILVNKKKINFKQKIKLFIYKLIYGKIFANFDGLYSHLNRHFIYKQKLDDSIEVKSIFDYCDLISSCDGFVTLGSGGSHLSSAIKNQFNKKLFSFCIIQKKWHNYHKEKGTYFFDNINYITI